MQLNPDKFCDAVCPICGMRRADPKHRGRQAQRCSKIRQARAIKAKAEEEKKKPVNAQGVANISLDALPDDALIRRPVVLALIGVSSTHLSRMIESGQFPAPRQLSPRVSVWPFRVVREWLASVSKGDS